MTAARAAIGGHGLHMGHHDAGSESVQAAARRNTWRASNPGGAMGLAAQPCRGYLFLAIKAIIAAIRR